MKKVSIMLVAVLFFSCCCKHEQKMVEKAAYEYSYAMANYQIDEAEKYATEETKNTTLNMAKKLSRKWIRTISNRIRLPPSTLSM